MSDPKNPSRYTGVDRRAPRIEVGPNGLPLPREAYKPGGRHAAITNTLYSWHSYKNWADKVRATGKRKSSARGRPAAGGPARGAQPQAVSGRELMPAPGRANPSFAFSHSSSGVQSARS